MKPILIGKWAGIGWSAFLSAVWLLGRVDLCTAEDINPPNLAENAGFEKPPVENQRPSGWIFFSSKVSTMGIARGAVKRSGKQCVKISAQKIPGAFLGMTQVLPVRPGERYTFSVYVLNDRNDPLGGSAYGRLNIEWQDDAGKEISRISGVSWDGFLSRLRWERISIRNAVAPEKATQAVFGIHLLDGENGGKGAIYIDDVTISR